MKRAQILSNQAFAAVLSSFKAFNRDERGATAIEYGLIAALIGVAVVASVRAYTNTTSDMYNELNTTYEQAFE